MQARYDDGRGARATRRRRACSSGSPGSARSAARRGASSFDVAVFNPSPQPRTDVVRFALDPARWFEFRGDGGASHGAPSAGCIAGMRPPGFTVDGQPARLVAGRRHASASRLAAGAAAATLEFVATDVPAFGWRRFRLAPVRARSPRSRTTGARSPASDRARARSPTTARCACALGGRSLAGLAGVEDVGDRGDTYDFDPVDGDGAVTLERVDGAAASSTRAASSTCWCGASLRVPAALDADRARAQRGARRASSLEVEARVAPGVPRVDLDGAAREHARATIACGCCFPTGRAR